MSTNSSIAIVNLDGTVSEIYCHWDGYPDWVGKKLATIYNTREKIEALIALGDLSSLHDLLEPTKDGHSFDLPEENVTVAYHRDRGEPLKIKGHSCLAEYRVRGMRLEFNYIFMEDEKLGWTWMFFIDEGNHPWVSLMERFNNLEREEEQEETEEVTDVDLVKQLVDCADYYIDGTTYEIGNKFVTDFNGEEGFILITYNFDEIFIKFSEVDMSQAKFYRLTQIDPEEFN